MKEKYKVPQGEEVLFKGVWYRQGDIMPDGYKKPALEAKTKKTKKEGE